MRIYDLILTVIANQEDQDRRQPFLTELRLTFLHKKVSILKGTPNALYKFLSSMTNFGFIKEYIEYCRVIKDPLVCTSVNLKARMHKVALVMKLERALIETEKKSGSYNFMFIDIFIFEYIPTYV
jgi:hypothetical protein